MKRESNGKSLDIWYRIVSSENFITIITLLLHVVVGIEPKTRV
jgi:hypothetical protein